MIQVQDSQLFTSSINYLKEPNKSIILSLISSHWLLSRWKIYILTHEHRVLLYRPVSDTINIRRNRKYRLSLSLYTTNMIASVVQSTKNYFLTTDTFNKACNHYLKPDHISIT